MSRIIVTGGAGFLGSHLVDDLLSQDFEVTVIDNLSSGAIGNLTQSHSNPRFKFIGRSVADIGAHGMLEDCDIIFHMAANADVRNDSKRPLDGFEQDILTTRLLLEWMRKSRTCQKIVFASSSAVYGEPSVIPTPESFGPLRPISVYGATKLACEALISAFCYSYGFEGVIFRLANVVGPRAGHGVIADFIAKLSQNANELEILGDGTQEKSYVYIDDAIKALLLGVRPLGSPVSVLNVGSKDTLDVMSVARIVSNTMSQRTIMYKISGGVDGGRGWLGDVKRMFLDTRRIEKLGWRPIMSSEEAVEHATKEMLGAPNATSAA